MEFEFFVVREKLVFIFFLRSVFVNILGVWGLRGFF